ncbi:MAG TPA: hypothetical protein VL633_08615 [Bacteroidota bacterium]|nr:hypothetical protein [Bacteroidota bacterium]
MSKYNYGTGHKPTFTCHTNETTIVITMIAMTSLRVIPGYNKTS